MGGHPANVTVGVANTTKKTLMFICFVSETIKNKKRIYEYEHRFDKPPVAKCYCIDCVKWDPETHECGALNNRHTADSWFCWQAEPGRREFLEHDT